MEEAIVHLFGRTFIVCTPVRRKGGKGMMIGQDPTFGGLL